MQRATSRSNARVVLAKHRAAFSGAESARGGPWAAGGGDGSVGGRGGKGKGEGEVQGGVWSAGGRRTLGSPLVLVFFPGRGMPSLPHKKVKTGICFSFLFSNLDVISIVLCMPCRALPFRFPLIWTFYFMWGT